MGFTLTLKSKIPFGKYRGKTGREIAGRDPGYITWMERNLEHVAIAPEVRSLAVSVGIMESDREADAFGDAGDWGFDPF